MCWQHLMKAKGLRLKASGIPGAGKGLFAMDDGLPSGTLMFKKGQMVVEYDGQVIDQKELVQRYGDFTAPYGIQATAVLYEDGACRRGVGTMVNHSKRANVKFYRGAQNRIKLRAMKHIYNGQELLVNYGREYNFVEPVRVRYQ